MDGTDIDKKYCQINRPLLLLLQLPLQSLYLIAMQLQLSTQSSCKFTFPPLHLPLDKNPFPSLPLL